jgi:membrane protease YdiL (CAAX protease family)
MSAIAASEDRVPFVIGACLFALALRPVGYAGTAITLAAGVAGAVLGSEAIKRARATTWAAVTVAGVAAFAFVRFAGHALPARLTAVGIGASVLAAVAEELFFRRLLYSRLERWGPAAAVTGAAAAFALVHVPSYGIAAAPIDLAAGLVLGWQRWATGSWTAPAATHVFANLVQIV